MRTTIFLLLVTIIHMPALARVSFPALPEPVANNAVARVSTNEGDYLLSFMGLGPGKTYKDVHNKTWALKLGQNSWQAKSPVPSSLPLKGRLASIAVGIKDKAYVFGGYTVAKDHSEISSPDNFVYDVLSDSYQSIAKTPIPTDDAIALVYQQRYIYLISGWHNDGNVNLTQIYDTKTDQWQQASPFLGAPVFGHAGAISANQLLVCDGVKVVAQPDKRRTFAAEPACYSGVIDSKNISKIDWRQVQHPTGAARYRMAASEHQGDAVFFGGSDNPYNYNGIGYNGVPSTPSADIWRYSFKQKKWQISTAAKASMDHRGLIKLNNNQAIVIGGMLSGQQVSDKIAIINLN